MAQNAPSGFFATPAQAGLRSRQGRHPNQKDAQACYSGSDDGFISGQEIKNNVVQGALYDIIAAALEAFCLAWWHEH
ncbi:hypothetical protein MNG63_002578 [Salmonella enterica]|nr:hypothetical protein [Salmonella enterica]